MKRMDSHDISIGAGIALVACLAAVGRLLDSSVYWTGLWYLAEFLGWYILIYYLEPVVAKKAAKRITTPYRKEMAFQCTLGLVLFDLLLRH